MPDQKKQKMVFFDDEIDSQILKIIGDAHKEVVLVTGYLDLWVQLKAALSLARVRGVDVSVLFRADNAQKAQVSVAWMQAHGIQVGVIERLHAKLYLNERSVLLSSMNLTEDSTNNSFDAAIVIADEQSQNLIRRYVNDRLIKLAQPPGAVGRKGHKSRIQEPKSRYATTVIGACIRCRTGVPLNNERPLCEECYDEWAEWENEEYEEKFCHACGKPEATCYARPLCATCYRRTG